MEDTDLALVLLAAAVGALSNMSILMEVSIYHLCSFFFLVMCGSELLYSK